MFGFFLYRPFLEERFPAVVAGQEKAPDTLSHKTVFFYAWTPTFTLQAVGGKACPNGYKGERESHHGGANYQSRGATITR